MHARAHTHTPTCTRLPPPPPPQPSAPHAAAAAAAPHAARGPLIYYFDASAALAASGAAPACDLDDPTGPFAKVQALLARRSPHFAAHHSLGQHAGPWFVARALLASPHVTRDPSAAHLAYVDVACYFLTYWWARHLRGNDIKALGFDALAIWTPRSPPPAAR